jgi:hypothetical protein
MGTIAGPGIADPQGLKHEKRLAEGFAVLQCAIKRKVVAQPAVGNHPVQHILPVRLNSLVICLSNSKLWDLAHARLKPTYKNLKEYSVAFPLASSTRLDFLS